MDLDSVFTGGLAVSLTGFITGKTVRSFLDFKHAATAIDASGRFEVTIETSDIFGRPVRRTMQPDIND